MWFSCCACCALLRRGEAVVGVCLPAARALGTAPVSLACACLRWRGWHSRRVKGGWEAGPVAPAPTQKISGRRKIGPSQPIVRGLFARLPGAKKGFWLNRRIKGKSSGLMGENLLLSGRCSTFLAVGENSGKALGFNGEKPSSYLGAALCHFGCVCWY